MKDAGKKIEEVLPLISHVINENNQSKETPSRTRSNEGNAKLIFETIIILLFFHISQHRMMEKGRC